MLTLLSRKVCLPLGLSLGVWLPGCGTTAPLNEEGPAPAKSESTRQANLWQNRLVQGEGDPRIEYGPVTIGGRNLLVRSHPIAFHIPLPNGEQRALFSAYYPGAPVNEKLDRSDGNPYELIDADSGETILPMDFWQIMAVPGKAVYVRTPEERLANRWSIGSSRKRGDGPWHTVDVRSGELRPSDVYFVGSMNPERKDKAVGRDYDPLVDPVALHRVDPDSTVDRPLTEVEILPPPRSVLERTITRRVVGQPHERLNKTVGRFDLLRRLEADGTPSARLLADGIATWLDTPGECRIFDSNWMRPDPERKGTKPVYSLGLRSPGTTDADDLWLLLDEFGRFGAPQGVIGFRPLCTFGPASSWGSYTSHRWLIRFAEPQEDGAIWEMRGPRLGKLANNQRYLSFAVFDGLHWNAVGLDRDHEIDERPYLSVQRLDGLWLTRELDSPPPGKRTHDTILAVSNSLEEAKAKITARVLAQQSGHADFLEQKLQRQREFDFDDAIYKRNWQQAMALSKDLGPDAMYRVGVSMSRPPVDFLRAAAAVGTESQAKELRALAVAEEERYAAEVAAHRARQLEQQRLQEEARRHYAARSQSTGYSAPRSYLAAPPSGPSYEAKQRYKRNSSYSPHARNMGWQSPYQFD